MSDLKLGHCKTCDRLEPEAALIGGQCYCCHKRQYIRTCHIIYLVFACIAAAISTVGLIFCLWRG